MKKSLKPVREPRSEMWECAVPTAIGRPIGGHGSFVPILRYGRTGEAEDRKVTTPCDQNAGKTVDPAGMGAGRIAANT
jgi:hypothetical protein